MRILTKITLTLFLFGFILYGFLSMPEHPEKLVRANADTLDKSIQKVKTLGDSLQFQLFIPDTFSFCSEKVPLDDFTVKEALEEELLVTNYWFSLIVKHIKRSQRWFPTIEQILSKERIPNDMKYLSVALSGLGIYSSYRNAGFWRLSKNVANDYNLRINNYIDERHHLEKATISVCKFLKKAHNRLGNWTLAMMAYRMGIDELERKLEKQKVSTVYNLYLNEWDTSFLYKVITIKMVMEQPDKYDIYVPEGDRYLPWQVKTKKGSGNLVNFAKRNGITYKMLRVYNPWLKRYDLRGNNYELTIPE